jgi:signal transduction histidine kinase
LARADSGYTRYHLAPILSNDLVSEVAELSGELGNRTIRVAVKGNVEAMVDRDRLKQVLINLLDNAIKYSGAAQPLELIVEQIDKQAIIRVRDRGIGIPLQDLGRVFDRVPEIKLTITPGVETAACDAKPAFSSRRFANAG